MENNKNPWKKNRNLIVQVIVFIVDLLLKARKK